MTTEMLPSINCPSCGARINDGGFGPASAAEHYQSCRRRCEQCGIGLSNRRTASFEEVTHIYRNPLQGLPANLHDHCLDVLKRALNEYNRADKLRKFHFSTSEDRLTWSVFRSLQQQKLIRPTFAELGFGPAVASTEEPAMLLWGAPCPPDDQSGISVREKLTSLLLSLHEGHRFFTEPDVILDFGTHGLVIIEVKFRSGNLSAAGRACAWNRFLSEENCFHDPAAVQQSGLYELARNWGVGCNLADEKPFVLANLGLASLFNSNQMKALSLFQSGIVTGKKAKFEMITWSEFLEATPQSWSLQDELARLISG